MNIGEHCFITYDRFFPSFNLQQNFHLPFIKFQLIYICLSFCGSANLSFPPVILHFTGGVEILVGADLAWGRGVQAPLPQELLGMKKRGRVRGKKGEKKKGAKGRRRKMSPTPGTNCGSEVEYWWCHETMFSPRIW